LSIEVLHPLNEPVVIPSFGWQSIFWIISFDYDFIRRLAMRETAHVNLDGAILTVSIFVVSPLASTYPEA
jgi:hypothetical protein